MQDEITLNQVSCDSSLAPGWLCPAGAQISEYRLSDSTELGRP